MARRGSISLPRLACLALLVLACRPSHAVPRGVRVVDDAGEAVPVPVPARRIVSLNPATTEILFAIGAGAAVVGRTAWCDYPPEAERVANLGDGINPNLEAVVARRPDLVLLYRSGQNAEAVRRLAALGIAALRLRTDSLSDVGRLARLLGALTGHELAADSLARAFEADLASATAPPAARRPTAFLLVWDQPPMTVGRGSFLTELMERAGLENLFADVGASSAPVSIEAVAARDPDVILTLGDASPRFADRPEWRVVRAVRKRRFVHADGSEFSRPSPRAQDAVRKLRAALARVGVPP